MSSETEIYIHGSIDFSLDRPVWRIVKIAVRIRIFTVDRRGDDAVFQSQGAGYGFNSSGGSQRMAGHTLGTADI